MKVKFDLSMFNAQNTTDKKDSLRLHRIVKLANLFSIKLSIDVVDRVIEYATKNYDNSIEKYLYMEISNECNETVSCYVNKYIGAMQNIYYTEKLTDPLEYINAMIKKEEFYNYSILELIKVVILNSDNFKKNSRLNIINYSDDEESSFGDLVELIRYYLIVSYV